MFLRVKILELIKCLGLSMDFLVVVILLAVFAFVYFVKRSKRGVVGHSQFTSLNFPEWRNLYSAATSATEKLGIARSFFEESAHFANALGAFRPQECSQLMLGIKNENVVDLVNDFLINDIQTIRSVIGDDAINTSQARLIGALMIVSRTGIAGDSESNIRMFMKRF